MEINLTHAIVFFCIVGSIYWLIGIPILRKEMRGQDQCFWKITGEFFKRGFAISTVITGILSGIAAVQALSLQTDREKTLTKNEIKNELLGINKILAKLGVIGGYYHTHEREIVCVVPEVKPDTFEDFDILQTQDEHVAVEIIFFAEIYKSYLETKRLYCDKDLPGFNNEAYFKEAHDGIQQPLANLKKIIDERIKELDKRYKLFF